MTWINSATHNGYRTAKSADGRFTITKTPGKRDTNDTVRFSDGTTGTTALMYFSLLIRVETGVVQIGNYRRMIDAVLAAEALEPAPTE